MNDNFLRTMGYGLDEIKGRHHSLFVDEATRQSGAYRDFWAKLNRGEFAAGQFKRIGKGGREIWLQATYNPVFDDNGRPVKVVKFAADVSEIAVRAAEKLSVLDALSKSQAMIEFLMDGTIVTANENFLRTLNYGLDEVKGRNHSLFVDEATRQSSEYRDFWARLNRGEFVVGQFKRIGKGARKSGCKRPITQCWTPPADRSRWSRSPPM